MAFDRTGNLQLSDLVTSRVRAILVQPPTLVAAPDSLRFDAQSGGAPPALPQKYRGDGVDSKRSLCPEEAELATSWAAGVARDG
jgi:hypothetical protein